MSVLHAHSMAVTATSLRDLAVALDAKHPPLADQCEDLAEALEALCN